MESIGKTILKHIKVDPKYAKDAIVIRGSEMTLRELMTLGYQHNPNCWIGAGYLFCTSCKVYQYFRVYSKRDENGLQDDRLVCKVCENTLARRDYRSAKV